MTFSASAVSVGTTKLMFSAVVLELLVATAGDHADHLAHSVEQFAAGVA
jgi:hypothetical protein